MQNTNQINQISDSRRCGPFKLYTKSSFVDVYERLQSLRNGKVFCDIKLKTEDNNIIHAHKVVLSAACPYFNAMFKHFAERNYDLVIMRQIDSTALQLLINFIYSGQIKITERNAQVLLPAANFLLLLEVKEACCDFLLSQLCPSNCIGINSIADLHSCTKLIRSSELYIYQHFSEVFGGDEFLSLSSEQVIKLISSDKLTVPSEEKVFESVICWVKYKLGSRKCILPQLMEHVRLALTSEDYITKNVVENPLIKKHYACNHYIFKALNSLKLGELIPQGIWNKPRYGDKVILVVGGSETESIYNLEWYDPKTNQWSLGPELIRARGRNSLAVTNGNLVFVAGGHQIRKSIIKTVDVLDLSSESHYWQPSINKMLVERIFLGIGVINNNIYAVGGYNDRDNHLDSTEVFDYRTQKWCMISNMTTTRTYFGVGVLNDLLYVVGGNDHSTLTSNTAESYNPSVDMWTPLANMHVGRTNPGVGVLYGELYVVGGRKVQKCLKSVEKYTPSTGAWTTVADLNFSRANAGVVALDGLLYAVGGMRNSNSLNSMESYNPYTNTWTMVTGRMIIRRISPGVVAINRPLHF
ncbi:hypothetical protein QTP88_029299 [Uroleucon formosanum]